MRFLRQAELKASIALAKAFSSWSASALKSALSSVLPSMCASAGKLCTPALTHARQVVGSMSTSILRTGTMKRMRDCGSTPAMAKTMACTSCAPCSVSNVMRACAPAGLACARACWLLLMPTRFSKKETTERLASRCCTCSPAQPQWKAVTRMSLSRSSAGSFLSTLEASSKKSSTTSGCSTMLEVTESSWKVAAAMRLKLSAKRGRSAGSLP
mmetsp:Transcript_8818/g.20809  ORF Transcript_8818/g.20809 Transcript_8818/m.20809 type:complete len:213 (+) Transcript_8818:89-727(+)